MPRDSRTIASHTVASLRAVSSYQRGNLAPRTLKRSLVTREQSFVSPLALAERLVPFWCLYKDRIGNGDRFQPGPNTHAIIAFLIQAPSSTSIPTVPSFARGQLQQPYSMPRTSSVFNKGSLRRLDYFEEEIRLTIPARSKMKRHDPVGEVEEGTRTA
jgi:hypothetical protein